MSLVIPILKRSRRFGYVFWKKENDYKMMNFLGNIKSVEVIFEDKPLGRKKVDWTNKRISIGESNMRNIPSSKKNYNMILENRRRLHITCE